MEHQFEQGVGGFSVWVLHLGRSEASNNAVRWGNIRRVSSASVHNHFAAEGCTLPYQLNGHPEDKVAECTCSGFQHYI